MKKKYPLLLTQIMLPPAYGLMYYLLKGFADEAFIYDSAMLGIGVLAGLIILKLDAKWLYDYYHEAAGSQQNEGQNLQEKKLITRSLLFVLSLIPLSIFMITSTGSTLGVGAIIGLASGLLSEAAAYNKSPEVFKQRFLFQLGRKPTPNDVIWYIRGLAIFTLIYSILVIAY